MPSSNPSRPVVVDTTDSPAARLQPVPIHRVRLTDAFWQPRREINRTVTLPSQYQQCEETGRLDNFRRAAGKKDGPFQGIFFNDSDVYKWLEAAAWTLATTRDEALEAMVGTAITEIEAAQQPDGYLNTYYTFEKAGERWSNLKDMHELYCAGHLLQAAVAHFRATDSDRLLNVARRFADYICATFGPEEGKRPGTCGHEEVEMALVELARTTGDEKYRQQAQYFVDARGHGLIGGSPYHQDHKPFREQDRMIGHAVRHVYLCCGAADLLAETGEAAMREALDRLWQNMTQKQLYISGGIGSRYEGEAFGKDCELPNARAYTETCAAIGSVMWNWRMFLLEGNLKYVELIEHTLFNAVLPGLSLDGQGYFYQNPLADDGTHRRQPWFGCACCPPNVARLLASLPGYFYAVEKERPVVHVTLYAESEALLPLPDGREAHIIQHTDYPFGGIVEITVNVEGPFGLGLRVPEWCEEGATLLVNTTTDTHTYLPGSYVIENEDWIPGTRIMLILPMNPHRRASHPYALENTGRFALQRGPLLYCLEGVDNPDGDLRDVAVNIKEPWKEKHHRDLLGGVATLTAKGTLRVLPTEWEAQLYRTLDPTTEKTETQEITVTAIPYYAWANREAGPMQVWLQKG